MNTIRAIDIYFNEIDKINSEIKLEKDTYTKVLLAFEIGKIVKVIREMEEFKSGIFFENEKYTRYKDYI